MNKPMPLLPFTLPAPPRRMPRAWWWLICLLACLAFQPALRDEYTLDDQLQVLSLGVPNTPRTWLQALAEPWWNPQINPHSLWRPLTRITILAQKALHPGAHWPFYAVNIVILAACACLLAASARRLGFSAMAAGLAGCLFAVHPLHSEGVHQIVGRAESLVALFTLLGIWLLLRGGWRARWQWAAQAGCCLLAIAAKENGAIYAAFPGLLALLQWQSARLGRRPAARFAGWRGEWRLIWQTMGPYAKLLPALIIVTVLMVDLRRRVAGGLMITASETSLIDNPVFNAPFVRRLPAVLGVYAFSWWKFFWPVGLAPDYGIISLPFTEGWRWPMAWLGAALMPLTLLYGVINFCRGRRGWLIAAASFGAYLPTSNLLFPVGVLMAGRLLFFPLAGPCLWIAWGLGRLGRPLEKFARRMGRPRGNGAPWLEWAPAAAALTLLLTASWNFAPAWRNTEQFADCVLNLYPKSARSLLIIADVAYQKRDFKTGYEYALKSVLVHQSIESWDCLGANAAAIPGLEGKAEIAYQSAYAVDPPHAAEVLRDWGLLYESQGKIKQALEKYRKYLAQPYIEMRGDVETRVARLERMAKH